MSWRFALFFMTSIALASTPADSLLRNDWHVLVKTEGGNVSLIRNLPLAEAVQVYNALDPFRGKVSGVLYSVAKSDTASREILGPADWDGCHKAMKHQIDFKEYVVDGGPNKGRRAKSGSCALCNKHEHVWIDTPQP